MQISIRIDLRKRCLQALLATLIVTFPIFAFSDSSTHLDQAFGKSGVVKIAIGTGKAWGSAGKAWAAGSATQSDGKIVIAASLADSSFAHTMALVRVSPDGEMDKQFGNKGVVNTQIGLNSRPVKIAILPDGRVVVAGWSHVNPRTEGITVVMYKPDGTLDERFADDGVLIFPKRYSAGFVHSLAIQPDGKIVVGGMTRIPKEVRDTRSIRSATDEFLLLARINGNGSFDASFGENGVVVTDVGGGDVQTTALAIQHDGKVVTSGTGKKSSISRLIIARYTPNGSLDTGFGDNGLFIKTTEKGVYSWPTVSVLPDGKIHVIAGLVGGRLLAFRLQKDGSNDLTFGGGGIVTASMELLRYRRYAPVLQSDGKMLVCGLVVRPPKPGLKQPPFYYSIGVARFLPNGLVDSSFGINGMHVVSIGSVTDSPASMAVQENGRIVIVGHSDDQDSQQVVLIRLVP